MLLHWKNWQGRTHAILVRCVSAYKRIATLSMTFPRLNLWKTFGPIINSQPTILRQSRVLRLIPRQWTDWSKRRERSWWMGSHRDVTVPYHPPLQCLLRACLFQLITLHSHSPISWIPLDRWYSQYIKLLFYENVFCWPGRRLFNSRVILVGHIFWSKFTDG